MEDEHERREQPEVHWRQREEHEQEGSRQAAPDRRVVAEGRLGREASVRRAAARASAVSTPGHSRAVTPTSFLALGPSTIGGGEQTTHSAVMTAKHAAGSSTPVGHGALSSVPIDLGQSMTARLVLQQSASSSSIQAPQAQWPPVTPTLDTEMTETLSHHVSVPWGHQVRQSPLPVAAFLLSRRLTCAADIACLP